MENVESEFPTRSPSEVQSEVKERRDRNSGTTSAQWLGKRKPLCFAAHRLYDLFTGELVVLVSTVGHYCFRPEANVMEYDHDFVSQTKLHVFKILQQTNLNLL